ncbi:hypothetical protein LTR91_000356 [Friedmanniomyces endolithicus]|uniref:Uncharacterized protein n=1 Tax=Friedmanniomyces endolithicus TaxID=329885 RepID=A0AAN6FWY1_9PEZI|nr:hypothetical protein LTR35_010094 [Friedmanniomyces endolithicus]KAK0298312.1 hypothetical protein LTS00_003277 [Friedmanniomyces endolithicus]KAK0323806.1 hypothetical protein LTR82_004926 [Friedmanniomyces endolithicus]KAK0931407.1 hypothetical protein LTR57_000822 [Friedmanniomyces endolithicus]KAK1010800.1 hypothetical protein LTS01_001492 [Friedmanniomyces endolithicus]
MEDSTPGENGENDDIVALIDPLLEQMSSILRLSSPPVAGRAISQRARRFSDVGGVASDGGPATNTMPVTVRSHDGSRWLPAPVEESHRYGSPAKHDAEGLAMEDVEATLPVKPHSCDAATCALTRVFATTELLECILGFLDTENVWAHRLTNPVWYATIDASPELRLHRYVYPQFTRPSSAFLLLPLSLPGLVIELGQPIYLGQWISVTLTQEAVRRISPGVKPGRRVRSRSIFEGLRGGLGSRQGGSNDNWPAPAPPDTKPTNSNGTLHYGDLHITQPPTLGMQAFIIDPVTASDPESSDDKIKVKLPAPCAKLSCDAGITLGFLAETAESLLPSGSEKGVMFKAIVSFSKSEPVPRKRGVARSVTKIGYM